jgi:hypothetical protein
MEKEEELSSPKILEGKPAQLGITIDEKTIIKLFSKGRKKERSCCRLTLED